MNKPRRALKPDAQPWDEIHITTVPRYKQSDLSGDEWRISGKIQFLRKGKVVHEAVYTKLEYAVDFLKAEWHRAMDDAKGFFAGEGDICDQEGCKEPATVTYRVINRYCNEPYIHKPTPNEEVVIRKFCKAHATRGNAGFDDADRNYAPMEDK